MPPSLRGHSGRACLIGLLALIFLAVLAPAPALADDDEKEAGARGYLVREVTTKEDRTAIAFLGVAIESIEANGIVVVATDDQIAEVRALGFTADPLPRTGRPESTRPTRIDPRTGESLPAAAAGSDFPAGYGGFHTVAEANAEVKAIAAAHPGIVKRFSIGRSYQGRTLWAAKVSDNVQVDENEPEVLFDGLHHAREHMATEMTLAILRWLANGYGHDSRITRLVKEREIWIVFIVNPDGAVYDISGGQFHMWRKNRQPNPGYSYVGTDLNRNYGYRWGCCRGSDTWPGSNLYRGPRAWSAPEVRAMRDFIDSRVVGGRQQIRASITFHTSGRLVMWPYGYTYTDLPADMTQLDRDVLVTLGRKMAATNGYRPQQASDLYISSGTTRDWLYGRYRVFAYTFELTTGWYADDSTIPSETGRNRAAVLDLIDAAACPYGLIGRAVGFCGRFYDDLEITRGWRVDAAGTDTATDGRWERGNPSATTSNGPKQLGATASGQSALVTGRVAGSTPNANDLDGGLTSVTSPTIAVPGSPPRIRFHYYFAHSAQASSADLLRLHLVSGAMSHVIWTVRGGPVDRDGRWTSVTIRIPTAFAGRSVRLVFEAVDGSGDNLLEAGLDDIAMMRT